MDIIEIFKENLRNGRYSSVIHSVDEHDTKYIDVFLDWGEKWLMREFTDLDPEAVIYTILERRDRYNNIVYCINDFDDVQIWYQYDEYGRVIYTCDSNYNWESYNWIDDKHCIIEDASGEKKILNI